MATGGFPVCIHTNSKMSNHKGRSMLMTLWLNMVMELVVLCVSVWMWCPINDLNLSLVLSPVTCLNMVILLHSGKIPRLNFPFKGHNKVFVFIRICFIKIESLTGIKST